MKKAVLIFFAFIILYMVINTSNKTNDYYIIPNQSIRLRILANSNSVTDQYIKNKVKKNIESLLMEDINYDITLEKTRSKIKNDIPKYEESISDTFKKENYNKSFTVNYGNNYFPKKEYKGVVYEEGMYESLYITIGEGKGDNWWCVLFPPICSLEVTETDDIEYRFFIKDIIEKYLFKK